MLPTQKIGNKALFLDHEFNGISFRLYSTDEIAKLSVCEVTNAQTFDSLGLPTTNGLYDKRMGPMESQEVCPTCTQLGSFCPGHFGHIKLSLPAYNPPFFQLMLKIVKGSCLKCGRLCFGGSVPSLILKYQLMLLSLGLISYLDRITQTAKQHGFTEFNDDEIEASQPKKIKRCNLATEISQYQAVEVALDNVVKEALREVSKVKLEIGEDSSAALAGLLPNWSPSGCQDRSILDERNRLLKQFEKKYLFAHLRVCPYCSHNIPAVRHEQGRSVILGTGVGKSNLSRTPAAVPELGLEPGGVKPEVDPLLEMLPDEAVTQPANRGNPESILKSEEVVGGVLSFAVVTEDTILGSEEVGGSSVEREADVDRRSLDTKVARLLKFMDEQLASLVQTAFGGGGVCVVSPQFIQHHLRRLWRNDGHLLSLVFPVFASMPSNQGPNKGQNCCPLDSFFIESLVVPPNRFRPMNFVNGKEYEGLFTISLRQILEDSELIKMLKLAVSHPDLVHKDILQSATAKLPGSTIHEKLHFAWNQFQFKINCFYDSNFDKKKEESHSPGVRQIIDGKGGLFRKNMMGKRVNFAARSVITPDPYIDVDEIGIPEVFAKKLVYPEPVTIYNLGRLTQLVKLGPERYPGANFIVDEHGHRVLLSATDALQRNGIANRLYTNPMSLTGPKTVVRYVKNGDIFLVNRQPTLHKPSIMAHRARVLRGERTLRLNYASCKTYNADFDGDEMNAHYPQNEVARAEGAEIVGAKFQYLVPKDGSPISGLIQDHVISGVLLTKRDMFFERDDYQHLVLASLGNNFCKIKSLPPAIWKPVRRWTGKQVVSTMIINLIPSRKARLNIERKAKTSIKNWKIDGFDLPNFSMSDSNVIIRGAELLVGVMDKANYGPTAQSLVHACYELYGPSVSCRILSCFGRLFTTFLQLHGFTLGVQDILLFPSADKKRRRILRKERERGQAIARTTARLDHGLELKELSDSLMKSYSSDPLFVREMDFAMKQGTDKITNDINSVCLPVGLIKKFPENSLQLMIESGAKGSMVNAMQISCALGQIELEGARPPMNPAGRTLPSFMPYDPSLRAGGFVDGRFLTGIQPQECFFHSMAGREGLIDTAVKTSASGYLQRSIIKHLEGIAVSYDLSVRDTDSSVIQFKYGEDSLDVCKVSYLKPEQFPFFISNFAVAHHPEEIEMLSGLSPNARGKISKISKKIRKWKKTARETRRNGFVEFENANSGMDPDDMKQVWRELTCRTRKKYFTRCPDPVNTVFRSDRILGAIPERFEDSLSDFVDAKAEGGYLEGDTGSSVLVDVDQFKDMISRKVMTSLCDPGEVVGMLAAQSIGEPSTQMTLNTFHFAGRGDMNVTLGIPRVREIMMSGSCKLPGARVPFRDWVSQSDAEALVQKLDRLVLKKLISCLKFSESMSIVESASFRHYKVIIELLKPSVLKKLGFAISSYQILRQIEKILIRRIDKVLSKRVVELAQATAISTRAVTRLTKGGEDEQDQAVELEPDVPEVDADSQTKQQDRKGGLRGTEADDGGDSDVEESGDRAEMDAALSRQMNRHNDMNEYEGEADEMADIEPEAMYDDSDVEEVNPNLGTSDPTDFKETLTLYDDKPWKASDSGKATQISDEIRIKDIFNGTKLLSSYNFDTKKNRWCCFEFQLTLERSKLDIVALVKELVDNFVVQSVPRVEKAKLSEENGKLVLLTQGINLQEFFKHEEVLDVNKISCNDIKVMANIYGIEAASRTIIAELKSVFGAYGIEIDFRHLSLIADYMTQSGIYRSFNRGNMTITASALQRITFETSSNFLKESVMRGERDCLQSPSARLVGGVLPPGGTGFFDIFSKNIL